METLRTVGLVISSWWCMHYKCISRSSSLQTRTMAGIAQRSIRQKDKTIKSAHKGLITEARQDYKVAGQRRYAR